LHHQISTENKIDAERNEYKCNGQNDQVIQQHFSEGFARSQLADEPPVEIEKRNSEADRNTKEENEFLKIN